MSGTTLPRHTWLCMGQHLSRSIFNPTPSRSRCLVIYDKKTLKNRRNWLGSSTRWWQLKYVLFPPRSLGKIPILTNIFQLGWNHQLVNDSGQSSSRPHEPTCDPPMLVAEKNRGWWIIWIRIFWPGDCTHKLIISSWACWSTTLEKYGALWGPDVAWGWCQKVFTMSIVLYFLGDDMETLISGPQARPVFRMLRFHCKGDYVENR